MLNNQRNKNNQSTDSIGRHWEWHIKPEHDDRLDKCHCLAILPERKRTEEISYEISIKYPHLFINPKQRNAKNS